MEKWEPEMYVKQGDRLWCGANVYEAVVSHRTGHLPLDLNVKDRPGELWHPVCWICDRVVTPSDPGHEQGDGFWVHEGDCTVEDINRGIENMENFDRSDES